MAKRISLLFFSLLLIAGQSLWAVADDAIIDIVRQVKPAVVTVITYDRAGGKLSQGSGFFVDASHVITDWHVIEDAAKVEVKCADGKVIGVSSVASGNQRTDLASLALSKPNADIKPLVISPKVPEAGERVVVIGSPYGLDATVSDGIVSEVRVVPDLGRAIQISAPISHGSSGSPVVNLKGEVIGVAQAIHSEGQNLNFAIPADRVLALSKGGGEVTASVPSGSAAGPATADNDSFSNGMELFKQKRYVEALPHLREAAKSDPDNYMAWFTLGHCYIQTDKYPDARAAFLASVKIKPDFVEGYCSLGAALGLMGKHSEALEVFKTALRIEPNSAIAHFGAGLEYVGTGDTTSAMKEYRLLQALDPNLAGQLYRVMQ